MASGGPPRRPPSHPGPAPSLPPSSKPSFVNPNTPHSNHPHLYTPPGIMPRTRDEATARIGELLLRGHVMLADACNVCAMPLMQDRATMLKQCTQCDAVTGEPIADAGKVPPGPAAAAPPDGAADRAQTGPAAGPSARGRASTADGRAAEIAATRARLEAEALAFENAVADAAAAAPAPGQTAAAAPVAPALSTDASATPPSELIANRMLAGWTLLGQHCPVCSTPLVQDKRVKEKARGWGLFWHSPSSIPIGT